MRNFIITYEAYNTLKQTNHMGNLLCVIIIIIVMVLFYLFIQYYAVLKEICYLIFVISLNGPYSMKIEFTNKMNTHYCVFFFNLNNICV